MNPSDPFFGIGDSDKTVMRPGPGGRRSDDSVKYVVSPDMGEQEVAFIGLSGDNLILDNAYSLLSLVPKLRHLPYLNAIQELRGRLIRSLTDFENRAVSQGIPKNQVNIAKFFLCTLLDEAVLNTPWGSQSGWGHNSLSSKFFRKLAGGEEFFRILEKLKQQPSKSRNLMELALLCLNLGFEGKYRYMKNGHQALEDLRQDLYQKIRETMDDGPPGLSVNWQGFTETSHPLVRYVPLWVIAGVACVILMVIYIVFAVSIRDHSDEIFGELSVIARGLEDTPRPQSVYLPRSTEWGDRARSLLADEISRKQVDVVGQRTLRIYNMFQSGSANIRSEYQATLSRIAGFMQQEQVRVLIVGHTDSQKLKFSTQFSSNWQLSRIRAENTVKALASHGVPMENMRFEGRADHEPIVPDTTTANRALNRRIDIIIR